jgi:phosphoglycolate phosphatase-like HAD superfamily hydrolase
MAAAVERGGLDAVSPRPGVPSLPDALAAAGHRLGVLTNGVGARFEVHGVTFLEE